MNLLYAASRGYIDDVQRLASKEDPNVRDDLGNTPLHLAAAAGSDDHLKCCQILFKHPKINVNAQNDAGKTPLHQAAWRGNYYIVKALMSQSATNAHQTDHDGKTAFERCPDKDVRALLPEPKGDEDDVDIDIGE